MPASTVDLINAVAGLWKLVLAVAIIFAIIVFRKSLHKTLSGLKNFKYKRGETEVTVEGGGPPAKLECVSESMIEATLAPEKQDQIEDTKATEPKGPFSEMYEAFLDKRIEDAEDAFKRLQESKEEEKNQKLWNEAFYLNLRYQYANDATSLSKLEKLAENNEIRETALYWLAACHELSRNYPKAIETYRRALSSELPDIKRAQHTVALAKSLIKTGSILEALKELSGSLLSVIEPEAKAQLYQGIAEAYEADGNTTLRAIALQKVLHFTPENTTALFSAAYAQSNVELSPLSAVNYNTLLRFDRRHSSALNNLGVECDKLGLPMKCVSYYKNAVVEAKETLAMANLAYRYFYQGFEKEAQDLLDLAMSEKSPRRN